MQAYLEFFKMRALDNVKSLLNFDDSIQEPLTNLCKPLEHLGISNFGYAKITKDARYFRIGTHSLYTSLLFEEEFYNKKNTFNGYAHKDIFDHSGLTQLRFWNTCAHHQDCKRKVSNVWNGLSFYTVFPDHVEIWAMGGTLEDPQLQNYLVNNLGLLHKFMVYFRDKAKDIIDTGDQGKTIPMEFHEKSPHVLSPGTQNIDRFNQAIMLHHYNLDHNGHRFNVTQRELECLSYKQMGHSAKEIGKLLGISPRTVETYYQNLKIKSDLQSTQEVLNLCITRGLLLTKP